MRPSVSALLVALPLLSLVEAAVPGRLQARQNRNKQGGGGGNADPQSSLTLLKEVIASGFASDGQGANPEPGQVRSLTSVNNFINFCKPFVDAGMPLTNGLQHEEPSCNPTIVGEIPSVDNMPSCQFLSPTNLDELEEKVPFTIKMNIRKMQTGFFSNAQRRYVSAPQTLNAAGQIQGHSHVVVEKIPDISSTQPTDPTNFAFFKGYNTAAQGGVLSADVTDGLPAGTFRISSINGALTHQPVLVPVAQHGSLDCGIYIIVRPKGQIGQNNGNQNNGGNQNGNNNGQNNNQQNNNGQNGGGQQNGQQNNNGQNRGQQNNAGQQNNQQNNNGQNGGGQTGQQNNNGQNRGQQNNQQNNGQNRPGQNRPGQQNNQNGQNRFGQGDRN